MAKLVTRLIDRAFEVDKPSGGMIVPEPLPPGAWDEHARKRNAGEPTERRPAKVVGGSSTTEVRITVAVEGESLPGGVHSWRPHLRRVIVRDVPEANLPDEFQRGGAEAIAANSTNSPDEAADALCDRYLRHRGW